MYPPFDLAQVYVKGSLKNTGTGFEFNIRNTIDSTMLSGIGPLVVNGKSYGGAAITLAVAGKQWQGDQIGWGNLVPVYVGSSLHVKVTGDPLPSGEVKISMTATTTDIGRVTVEITDTL